MTPSSPWSVREVHVLNGYWLDVAFLDGTHGLVDSNGIGEGPNAGVFRGLRDRALFEQVFVHCGAVAWPGELDLAPDAMYDDIRATGACKLL